MPGGILVAAAVLKDHEAGGLGGVVLLGHINPVVALGAGEYLARGEGVFGHFPVGRIGLGLGIGAERVVVRGKGGDGEGDRGESREEERAHERNSRMTNGECGPNVEAQNLKKGERPRNTRRRAARRALYLNAKVAKNAESAKGLMAFGTILL